MAKRQTRPASSCCHFSGLARWSQGKFICSIVVLLCCLLLYESNPTENSEIDGYITLELIFNLMVSHLTLKLVPLFFMCPRFLSNTDSYSCFIFFFHLKMKLSNLFLVKLRETSSKYCIALFSMVKNSKEKLRKIIIHYCIKPVLSFNTQTNIANICVYATDDAPGNCDSVNGKYEREKKKNCGCIYICVKCRQCCYLLTSPTLSSLIIQSSG